MSSIKTDVRKRNAPANESAASTPAVATAAARRNDNSKLESQSTSSFTSSSLTPILVCAHLLLFFIAFVSDAYLPKAPNLPTHTEPQQTPTTLPSFPLAPPASSFSTPRAYYHLHALANAGIRETGTLACESSALAYLTSAIEIIRFHSHPAWVIEVDLQRVTGSFGLNFIGGFTSEYQAVANLLVRVSWDDKLEWKRWREKRDKYEAEAQTKGEKPVLIANEKYLKPPSFIDRTRVSLLISGHYDAALGSPAASDDTVNIAVMLEILSSLTYHDQENDFDVSKPKKAPIKHSLVFNFNGAEETVLQASHGFVTSTHPFLSSISAFVNLEGAGGTGRELMFQSGPKMSWLAKSYATSTLYPFATSLGQDIFQSGIIPSDTDFRIYRDFGSLPGIDIAYISNGYIYHTKLDTPERVSLDAVERTGRNMERLVKKIANSEQLFYSHKRYRELCKGNQVMGKGRGIEATSTGEEREEGEEEYVCDEEEFNSDVVYFDVLGLFVVVYSLPTAVIINCTVAFLTLYYIISTHLSSPSVYTFSSLLRSLLIFLVGFLSTLLVTILIGIALIAGGWSMSWFANNWLLVGLYAAPAILVWGEVHRQAEDWIRGNKGKKEKDEKEESLLGQSSSSSISTSMWLAEEQTFMSHVLIWLIGMLICMYLEFASSFLPMLQCGFPVTARLIARWTNQTPIGKGGKKKELAVGNVNMMLIYMVGLSVPFIFSSQATLTLFRFFIPLTGRSGTQLPSDLFLAVLISIMVCLCTSLSISYVHVDSYWKRSRFILIFYFLVSFLIATQLFPYAAERPKRMFAQHIERTQFGDFDYSSFMGTGEIGQMIDVKKSEGKGKELWSDVGLWLNAFDYWNLEPIAQAGLIDLSKGTKMHCNRNRPLPASSTTSSPPILDVEAPGSSTSGHNESLLYCDLPWYLPLKPFICDGYYFPDPSTPLPSYLKTSLELTQIMWIREGDGLNRHRRRLYFEARSAHHMTLILRNHNSLPTRVVSHGGDQGGEEKNSKSRRPAMILDWSFHSDLLRNERLNKSDEFFIYFASGMPEGKVMDGESSGSGTGKGNQKWSYEDGVISVEEAQRQIESLYGEDLKREEIATKEFSPSSSFGSVSSVSVPSVYSSSIPPVSSLAAPHTRVWKFWVEVADQESQSSSGIETKTEMDSLDLSLSGHFLEFRSPELNTFVSKAPKWLTSVEWVSHWHGYRF